MCCGCSVASALNGVAGITAHRYFREACRCLGWEHISWTSLIGYNKTPEYPLCLGLIAIQVYAARHADNGQCNRTLAELFNIGEADLQRKYSWGTDRGERPVQERIYCECLKDWCDDRNVGLIYNPPAPHIGAWRYVQYPRSIAENIRSWDTPVRNQIGVPPPARLSMTDLALLWDEEDENSEPELFYQNERVKCLDKFFPNWEKMLFVQDPECPADWEYQDCVSPGSNAPCFLIVKSSTSMSQRQRKKFSWTQDEIGYARLTESDSIIQKWFNRRELVIRLVGGIKFARNKWLKGAGPKLEIKNATPHSALYLNSGLIQNRSDVLINLDVGKYVLIDGPSAKKSHSAGVSFSIVSMTPCESEDRKKMGWVIVPNGFGFRFEAYTASAESESEGVLPIRKICGLDFSALKKITQPARTWIESARVDYLPGTVNKNIVPIALRKEHKM